MIPKNKIGVLLPQSKAYPTIGKSFLNGLRLATKKLDLDFVIESNGQGTNKELILSNYQKLVYQENITLTTGIFGHNGFKELVQFASENQEIIIAANLGAKRAIELPEGIYQNSLDLYDSLQQLTTHLSKEKKQEIATSTCYYEAGYGFIEAIENVVSKNENTSFSGHFITPLHPRENESELMDMYFSEINPDTIIAFHNGIYAKEHASFLQKNKLYKKYPIYALPHSVDNTYTKDFPEVYENIKPVSSWYPELDNKENIFFITEYKKTYNKTPDFFALLGYENGLIIKNALLNNTKNLNIAIKKTNIKGPRGIIKFCEKYNKTNYHYYIWNNALASKKIHQKITSENNFHSKNTPNQQGGWFNTYLCN